MKTNILSIIVALTVISTPANLVAQGNAQAGKFGSQASIKNSSDYSWSNPSPIKVMPFALNDNTRLTIISPTKWQSTANLLKKSLRKSYSEFTKIFGEIPSFKTNIKLMDDEEFYLATGAPRWTNAMYYKEQIIIPLASKGNINYQELYRSVKHEFTHAVVHSLSEGKCPGWLDEGLAQWAEGSENPALRPALEDWLEKNNQPVPLSALQGGFTKLKTSMVPAAYAQSLFAANTIMDFHGFANIQKYFAAMRQGYESREAFKVGFGISEREFEKSLGRKLSQWSKHTH